MEHELYDTLVIDVGSFTTRAGLSIQDSPKVQMPTIVGRPILASAVSLEHKDLYIGREAEEKRDILNLFYPVRNATIQSWDEVEQIYNHLFSNEIMVDISEHKGLMIVSPHTSRSDKERLAEMMFNHFGIYAIYICNSAVMSLFATGRTTGVVIESGLNQTFVVPIFEGYALPHATLKLEIGGEDITNYLVQNLLSRRQALPQGKEFEVAQAIKQELCYLSPDFQEDVNTATSTTALNREYELSDNHIINVGAERFKSPEIIFQPMLVGKEQAGIHELVFKSIMKCDPDIRRELFGNIVLSGGNTMFPKIKEKLWRDVKALAPSNVDIKVKAPPERKHLPWIGGAILSSIEGFSAWVTKAEYDQIGPSIIHRKCF